MAGVTAGDLLFSADIDNVGVSFIPELASLALILFAVARWIRSQGRVGRVWYCRRGIRDTDRAAANPALAVPNQRPPV